MRFCGGFACQLPISAITGTFFRDVDAERFTISRIRGPQRILTAVISTSGARDLPRDWGDTGVALQEVQAVAMAEIESLVVDIETLTFTA
jgi:hypothetical protein